MATQALYNKWRGQTFEDILGQEHITTTRTRFGQDVLAMRVACRVARTGKTPTARILPKR